MDFNNIWKGLAKTVSNLIDGWPVKVGMAGLLAAAEVHIELLFLFAILVFIDLFSKWIALSYGFLGDGADRDVLTCIKAIPAAHRAGVINSNSMKTRFVEKILVYLFIVISAGIGDYVFIILGKTTLWVSLAVGYLAATEILSILENLNDAGVDGLTNLISLVKSKQGK